MDYLSDLECLLRAERAALPVALSLGLATLPTNLASARLAASLATIR